MRVRVRKSLHCDNKMNIKAICIILLLALSIPMVMYTISKTNDAVYSYKKSSKAFSFIAAFDSRQLPSGLYEIDGFYFRKRGFYYHYRHSYLMNDSLHSIAGIADTSLNCLYTNEYLDSLRNNTVTTAGDYVLRLEEKDSTVFNMLISLYRKYSLTDIVNFENKGRIFSYGGHSYFYSPDKKFTSIKGRVLVNFRMLRKHPNWIELINYRIDE